MLVCYVGATIPVAPTLQFLIFQYCSVHFVMIQIHMDPRLRKDDILNEPSLLFSACNK
jgi:hypothetical protein